MPVAVAVDHAASLRKPVQPTIHRLSQPMHQSNSNLNRRCLRPTLVAVALDDREAASKLSLPDGPTTVRLSA